MKNLNKEATRTALKKHLKLLFDFDEIANDVYEVQAITSAIRETIELFDTVERVPIDYEI